MIANLSLLGGSDPGLDRPQEMAILLLHESQSGWQSSQFNARCDGEPWSAFRWPSPGPRLRIAGGSGSPMVDLALRRTGRGCTSQCAPFAHQQHLRWQSEPGIQASGSVRIRNRLLAQLHLIGYHERVRGAWGWPELGGWVFGFANAAARPGEAPEYAVVFTLIQPPEPADAATGSVMLWRRGRLVRHFPRRRVQAAVAGHLSRDEVHACPPLAGLLGARPAAPVPQRLIITASMGNDRLCLDVLARTAGRIINPSESGLLPFSVHEVLGPCLVTGRIGGNAIEFRTGAVVEFAGGAVAD
jgi:hypothetical protein